MNNNLVTKEEFEKFIEKHTIGYALNLEDYIKYNQHVSLSACPSTLPNLRTISNTTRFSI